MLTVFRDTYFPWQLTFNFHRSLSDINLVFMKETLKLTHGQSLLDFFYNSLGNVLWFIPFGFLFPTVIQKKSMVGTILAGGCLSVIIESLQFVLRPDKLHTLLMAYWPNSYWLLWLLTQTI